MPLFAHACSSNASLISCRPTSAKNIGETCYSISVDVRTLMIPIPLTSVHKFENVKQLSGRFKTSVTERLQKYHFKTESGYLPCL